MDKEYEIYTILKKRRCWMTSTDIAKIVYKQEDLVCARQKTIKKLNQLVKFHFCEEKQRAGVKWGNERVFRCL